MPRRAAAFCGAETRGAFVGTLLRFEDEVAAFEEVDEADGLLAAFVRDGDRLLEDVGIAIGIRGGGVRGIDIEDGAEVDDERLRIRPLGGRGVAPLFEELGRGHVGASVAEADVVRKEGRIDLPSRMGSRPLRKGKTPPRKGKKPFRVGLEPSPVGETGIFR